MYDGPAAMRMAVLGNIFYFSPVDSDWYLKSFNMDTNIIGKIQMKTSFNGTGLASPNAAAIGSDSIWAVSRQRLWTLGLNGDISSWANLPESVYSALVYPTGIAKVAENEIVIYTERGTDVAQFYLNISNFK